MGKTYYVYVMSNISRTLYIGITADLERRVWQHRQKATTGFTRDYNVTMLVYVETFSNPTDAIAREKQLKNWRRAKKVALVERENPTWQDLAATWFS